MIKYYYLFINRRNKYINLIIFDFRNFPLFHFIQYNFKLFSSLILIMSIMNCEFYNPTKLIIKADGAPDIAKYIKNDNIKKVLIVYG